MFYLKEFFAAVWDLKGRGVLFFVASLMLALVCVFRPSVDATVAALAPDAWARPYFTALFDNSVSREDVLEQITRRPEVAEVQMLNQTETTGVLGRLIASIGEEYQGKAADVAAFGLRVVLKNAKFSVEGETLLTGLEESYGKEHVTTSGVRTPKVGGLFQSHPLFKYLARFGYAGVLVPVAIVWVLAFTLCFGHFSRRAWIVERFQRRELVRAKTMAAGLAVLWAVCALFSIVLQGPDIIGLGLGVALFSIPWAATMREAQWRAPR